MGREEEILLLTDRLMLASMSDNDEEFEKCLRKVLESPENCQGVIDELTLDAELLLVQAIESARMPAPVLAPAPKPRAPMYSAVLAVLVIGVSAAFWLFRDRATEFVASSEPTRVELQDNSVMSMDPRSQAKVLFTRNARLVYIRTGGATFVVAPGQRPFKVNTPVGTATALGTRFYVQLIGAPESPEALLRVWSGRIRFDLPAKEPEARIVDSHGARIVEANEEARVTSAGHIEITSLSTPPRSLNALTEVTDEPLARLAARFNEQGHSPRIEIKGAACRAPISGTFNVDEPASLTSNLEFNTRFEVTPGDEVVQVRLAGDTTSPEDVADSECAGEPNHHREAPAANPGSAVKPSPVRASDPPAGPRP
jgi:transmembrane sensor